MFLLVPISFRGFRFSTHSKLHNNIMPMNNSEIGVTVTNSPQPASTTVIEEGDSEKRDKAVLNYRLTKKSAYGMLLVACASVFGR